MTEKRSKYGIYILLLYILMIAVIVRVTVNHWKICELDRKVTELETACFIPLDYERLSYRSTIEDELSDFLIPEEKPVQYYTDMDAEMLARLLYHECRGVPSRTERAAVAWTVLNRVDSSHFPNTIRSVITQKNQFNYRANAPLDESLLELAYDVLDRWNRECNGETDVGRVIPKEYLYFYGDGVHNYFYKLNSDGWRVEWDFHFATPYED